MVKQRLRALHIGERRFTWTARILHVPGTDDCHRGIRVRAWGAGKNSEMLQADLLSKSWPAPYGACATDGTYPTGGDVRELIDFALTHGWLPSGRGGSFRLTEAEHAADFELPGFLLTDRVVDPDAPDPTARVVRAQPSAGTRNG